MRKIITAIFMVPALLQAPAAFGAVATIKLVARVPVMCAVDFTGARVEEHRIVISVRRLCNTSHIVSLSLPETGASDLRVDFANAQVLQGGGSVEMPQPERYYDGLDQITIQSDSSDMDQLMDIARSMNVAVYPS